MTGADLTPARLREIAEAATPGPWEIRGEQSYDVWAPATANICGANIIMHDGGQTGESMYANRDFIATFDPPTVLSLLTRLEAQEAEIHRLGVAADQAATDADNARTARDEAQAKVEAQQAVVEAARALNSDPAYDIRHTTLYTALATLEALDD